MIKVSDNIILNENDIAMIEKIDFDSIAFFTNKNVASDFQRLAYDNDLTIEGCRKITVSFKDYTTREEWFKYIEIQLIKLEKMIEF